jgi:hypothetical protein
MKSPVVRIAHGSSVQARQRREVEVLQGLRLLEARPLEPQPETLGAAALELVLQQQLQELEVAELTLAGLCQAYIEALAPRVRA